MPLKLSRDGVFLVEATDFRKMLLKIKFAGRRIQDHREWRYARSKECPVYGAIASSNGLNSFEKTPRTTLRQFLKTITGQVVHNVEFVSLMRVFAGLPVHIGGVEPRCKRADCRSNGYTDNPVHARVCPVSKLLQCVLHNRVRDLLKRLLVSLPDVLGVRTEQPYHGCNVVSDVLVLLHGGEERHLDVSIVDVASTFYNKAHPSSGSHTLSTTSIFDSIAGGGVQAALQTRFKHKATKYQNALQNSNNPDTVAALVPMSEADVSWTPGDFRPIIFDSTGTLHLSSQKWLKGFLGTAKWNTFAHEASDLFAFYYGSILNSAARRWTAEAASIGEPRSAS